MKNGGCSKVASFWGGIWSNNGEEGGAGCGENNGEEGGAGCGKITEKKEGYISTEF